MTSYSHGAPTPRPSLTPWLLSAAVLAAMALWLWWDGRNLICE